MESLASKRAALADAWRAFVVAPDERNGRELHVLVHRLAGSAPAYGYGPLGELASGVDQTLADWEKTLPAMRDAASALAERLAVPMRNLLDAIASHVDESAMSSGAAPLAVDTLRVILVEDDPGQASMIGAQLEARGCAVRIESSAQMLLETLLIWPCHAVVLDFWLRGETAAEIAATLRRDPALERTALVCLSIERDPTVLRAALQAGCDATLGKAEGPDRLMDVLRDCVLRRHRG